MAYGTRRFNATFTRPLLRQINPIPRSDTYFFKIHFNIASHLRLGLPKGLFPAGIS